MLQSLTRDQVANLIEEAWNTYEQKDQHAFERIVRQLESETLFPNLREFLVVGLFRGDQSVEYVAERLSIFNPNKPRLTRDQMIDLVQEIVSAEGTEAELDDKIDLFEANCRHPAGSGLIYWPYGYPHDPTEPDLTVIEIVDKAMNGQ